MAKRGWTVHDGISAETVARYSTRPVEQVVATKSRERSREEKGLPARDRIDPCISLRKET
jgi:hypothetical protein